MRNKNDTNGERERVANDALLAVLREIEEARKEIAALYDKKRAIEDAEKEMRWKMQRSERKDKHRTEVKMLELAAKGMSVTKIAESLGVSKSKMDWKIRRAWRQEFPSHYKANQDKFLTHGILTALRDSPPIFSSANA